MHPLRVRGPRQRRRVEREHRSGHHAGEHVASPGLDEQSRRERRQRESGQEDDVVDEHGRCPHPCHRCTHEGGHDQWFGEREGIVRRIEDVGFEEVCRIAGKLVRNPGENPLVQLSVAVVVAGMSARSEDEGPRMQYGKQRTGCGRVDTSSGSEHLQRRLWRKPAVRSNGVSDLVHRPRRNEFQRPDRRWWPVVSP